jgi:hypothetical protein
MTVFAGNEGLWKYVVGEPVEPLPAGEARWWAGAEENDR